MIHPVMNGNPTGRYVIQQHPTPMERARRGVTVVPARTQLLISVRWIMAVLVMVANHRIS